MPEGMLAVQVKVITAKNIPAEFNALVFSADIKDTTSQWRRAYPLLKCVLMSIFPGITRVFPGKTIINPGKTIQRKVKERKVKERKVKCVGQNSP